LQGEILLAKNQLPQAETAFLAAAGEYPNSLSHIGLAHVYQSQQRWEIAAQEWEKVLGAQGEILENDFPPDVLFAHLELARAYRTMKDRDRALSHYKDFLRLLQHADDLPVFLHAKREAEQFASQTKTLAQMFPATTSHGKGCTMAYIQARRTL
jgi:tetratricopeptide (TPR) repeat protein